MGCCIFMFLLVCCIFEILYLVGLIVWKCLFVCLNCFLFIDDVVVSR